MAEINLAFCPSCMEEVVTYLTNANEIFGMHYGRVGSDGKYYMCSNSNAPVHNYNINLFRG